MLKRMIWAMQDFKAWRRGEKRIAPHGVTGRIYERKEPSVNSGGNAIDALTAGVVSIKARQFHAATGEWDDLGEIAKGTIEKG